MICDIINSDCLEYLALTEHTFDLTFLDPPFNQNKNYNSHNDKMDPIDYWNWMKEVCIRIFEKTSSGGAIYFMQREKNVKEVISILEEANWTFHNLIIWKKKSSVWDDIRELTSGYFAGEEPLRLPGGERLHNQQSPIQLLLRIILSSSKPGDFIFDPFAGTATTNVVSRQLSRNSICIEKDELYFQNCLNRLNEFRDIDSINRFKDDYKYTENLNDIWGSIDIKEFSPPQYTLFDKKINYKKDVFPYHT